MSELGKAGQLKSGSLSYVSTPLTGSKAPLRIMFDFFKITLNQWVKAGHCKLNLVSTRLLV